MKVLKYMVEENLSAAELSIGEIKILLDCSEKRSKILAGVDAFFSVGLLLVIFLYTSEFFSARAFTSFLGLSSNYTAVNVAGHEFDCDHYAGEMPLVWNRVYNAIGCAGAVSAALLGRSLIALVRILLKKLDNISIALGDHTCRDELRAIFFERIVVKLIAAGLSIPIGLCFREMALANIEHLDILQNLKTCNITGLDVKLPSIPGAGYVVANVSFFISFMLSFMPIFLFFNAIADRIKLCNPVTNYFRNRSVESQGAIQSAPLAVPEESISAESISDVETKDEHNGRDSKQCLPVNVVFNEMP
ncbi:hypothetical protein [Kistimonas scapharcae]|uniref:hypothetical protein n=1 Tax=Kistimonas scapharcae TaxID=1036133 RepID=UPI0031E8A0B5